MCVYMDARHNCWGGQKRYRKALALSIWLTEKGALSLRKSTDWSVDLRNEAAHRELFHCIIASGLITVLLYLKKKLKNFYSPESTLPGR